VDWKYGTHFLNIHFEQAEWTGATAVCVCLQGIVDAKLCVCVDAELCWLGKFVGVLLLSGACL